MAFRRLLLGSAVVLTMAIGIGIWEAAPFVVARLIKRADSPDAPMGLVRLKLAHGMAGGLRDAEAADEIIANSIKAIVKSKVMGPTDTLSRGAWRALLDVLHAAERQYLAPAYGFGLGPPEFGAAEVAEGLKYVSHVLRVALELHLEESPRFMRFVSPHLKLLGDNPDALYYLSRVDPSKGHRLSGCRTREVYFSISIHAEPDEGEALAKVIADVNDDGLVVDANGCWQLVLTPTTAPPADLPAGAVWRSLPAAASTIVTRHYFETSPPAQLNQDVERSLTLSIECWTPTAVAIDTPEAAGPIADSAMAQRLSRAADFVRDHTINLPPPDPSTAPPFFALVPNSIGIPTKWSRNAQGMGAVDIAYAAGRFLLHEGEALIIRGTLPNCRFANAVLWNRFLQSFDYLHGQVSVSRANLHLSGPSEADFTLVLAASNPFADKAAEKRASANWLSTEGRPSGTLFLRFVLPKGDIKQPTTQLVPSGESVVAALEKAAALA